MAHIFFERLERRRSTQSLLAVGWPMDRYPNSGNGMMPIPDLTSYSATYAPSYNASNQPLSRLNSFQWDTQYSSISNMSFYNGQTARTNISSLFNNLFTPRQQSWNLGIGSIGSVGSYQPGRWYPEGGGRGGFLPEIVTYYGVLSPGSNIGSGIGYPIVGGIGRGISIHEWKQVRPGMYGLGDSSSGIPYPGAGGYYGAVFPFGWSSGASAFSSY